MKMRKVLTIGLFLNGLTCLNAGFLSENICDYRSLNAIEHSVLGSSEIGKDFWRRICYIETRQIYSRTPAANYEDEHLRQFMEEGIFDTCYGKTVGELVGLVCGEEDSISGESEEKEDFLIQKIIAIWFIRKGIDIVYGENNNTVVIKAINGMKVNFLLFWNSYETISKTLSIAGSEDAVSTVKDTKCLNYPAAISEVLKKTVTVTEQKTETGT